MKRALAALTFLFAAGLAPCAYGGACSLGWSEDANGGCAWIGCPTEYRFDGQQCVSVTGTQPSQPATDGPAEKLPAGQPPLLPPKAPQLDGGLMAPLPAPHRVAGEDSRSAAPSSSAGPGSASDAVAGGQAPAALDAPAPAQPQGGRPASAPAGLAAGSVPDGSAAAPAAAVSLDKAVDELVSMPLPRSRGDARFAALLSRGTAALTMSDPGAAARDFEEAVRLEPQEPQGWIGLSRARGKARQFEAAEAAALQAVRAAARSAQAWDQQAWALLKEGRYAEAAQAATRALELDPNDAFAYAVRARAKSALGDRAGALADAEAAARLDARFQPLLDALRAGRGFDDEDPAAGVVARGAGRPWAWPLAALLLLAGLLAGRRLLGGATKVRTFSALLPGRRDGLIAGKYELKGLLGSGAMGQVFDAVDHSLKRHVAIKKISGEATRDPEARRRFVEEARTVAAVSHPNIVAIYEVLAEGEEVHLVFELVSGKTVERLLLERPRLSVEETLVILAPVCSALAFAHERGLVHRDLKPANVMVAEDGFVKLMDFGVARALSGSQARALTQTIAGTPYFMAPEMLDGVVSREGDVYALAVTAYRMLTGAYPFQTWEEKRAMSFVEASARWPGLPAALDRLLSEALQADPSRRLKTPAEFLKRLRAAAAPQRTPPVGSAP